MLHRWNQSQCLTEAKDVRALDVQERQVAVHRDKHVNRAAVLMDGALVPVTLFFPTLQSFAQSGTFPN